jgi:hypothetical protein
MGRIYDAVQTIERIIAEKKLDPFKTKGMISIQIGFALGLVRPETPDDPAQLAALKAAAEQVLKQKV